MLRAGVIVAVILLATPLSASFARAAEPWQRIPLLADPRLAVTLLVKTSANPADEDFIGFDLHNRTDQPLPLAHAHYRLGGVHEQRGDRARARAAYETALKLDPGLEDATRLLAALR